MNKKLKSILIAFGVLIGLVLISIGFIQIMGDKSFIRTTLSGLTLGSLFFMVAAGLTLIFGLMDVLNFAHGSMFMLGAYLGWQFYTNPTFIFGVLPLILAFAVGVMLTPIIKPYVIEWKLSTRMQKILPIAAYVVALGIGIYGIWGYDIMSLADTAMVAISNAFMSDPLAEISAQEPLNVFVVRVIALILSGALVAFASSRPGDKTQFAHKDGMTKNILVVAGLLVATIFFSLVRESAPVFVLEMNGNWRFLLSIVTAVIFGLVLGALIEITLIRPLYVRHLFVVLMTLGLDYIIRELVQLLWDPVAYQMARPPLFSQPGKAENIWAWFSGHNTTVNIMGVTFPSYRLFVIVLGVLMFIFLLLLMNKTRLGMIIRAGVQDAEMVEALGINVRQVFTFVFALGVAFAALGGIGAAPFIPVNPLMGATYQMQGFITVVIGGMGSYVGSFVGAFILGIARSFGDFFAIKFGLSPSIAEASTVIIMIIVLLARPSGLFGKKD